MRCFSIGSLLAVVLVGNLAAQQPLAVPAAPSQPAPGAVAVFATPVIVPATQSVSMAQPVPAAAPEATVLMPVGASQLVGSAVVPLTTGHCSSGSCAAGCCETPTKTVCVPECTTKKVTTTLYSSVCEPFCLPKCSLFGLFGHCDGNCASCEHPRTKRYLVIKTCRRGTAGGQVHRRDGPGVRPDGLHGRMRGRRLLACGIRNVCPERSGGHPSNSAAGCHAEVRKDPRPA